MPRKNQVESLIGNRYGRLVVKSRAEDHIQPSGKRKIMWHCECDCGGEKDIWSAHLKNGSIQSCGCLKKELTSKRLLKDLTGERFGRLLVLKRVDDYVSKNGKKRSKWLCRCDCGNEKEIVGESLTSGSTKSCGCYYNENVKKQAEDKFVDLTNQIFGKLTVVKRVENNKHNQTMWLCQCECGRESIVQSQNLLSGGTRSCGCVKMSHLEQDVFTYFKRHGYIENRDFCYQLKYDNLSGIGKRKLSYDFGVYFDNKLVCLIECQGRQHYKKVEYFGDDFGVQKSHDELKREYAKEKLCVPLIEIPHTVNTYAKMEKFFETNIIQMLKGDEL